MERQVSLRHIWTREVHHEIDCHTFDVTPLVAFAVKLGDTWTHWKDWPRRRRFKSLPQIMRRNFRWALLAQPEDMRGVPFRKGDGILDIGKILYDNSPIVDVPFLQLIKSLPRPTKDVYTWEEPK